LTDALEDRDLNAAARNHPSTDHPVWIEPYPRRVRAFLDGVAVVDSTRALLLPEAKHLPVYYFQAQDVRTELLEPSDIRTHFPYKGDACYWSVRVGKRVARDAVWSRQDPLAERTDIKGYLACTGVDVLSSSWHVAREALGHDQLAQPRAAGHHAALAVRLAARRSAVQAASDAQRQLHALVVAASDSLRGRLRELEPTR